jgi:hypothetical protein
MVNLFEALSRMEVQLAALIEGSLARVFPELENRQTFAHRLVYALQAQIETDSFGGHHAPHTITLHASPPIADYLKTNPGVIDELADQIETAAAEAHITFDEPPVMHIITDPTLPSEEIEFSFDQHATRPGTTAVLPTEPGGRSQSVPANAYLIIEGAQVYNLNQPVTNLGRHADNHIVVNDRRVSRQHAQIRISLDRFTIFDLQSTGGTFVNGDRIHHAVLQPGDVISLAGVLIVFGQDATLDLDQTEEYRPTPGE